MMERFEELEIRVGTVMSATPHPRARIPAIQLVIDFGNFGLMRSSAQITTHYAPDSLTGCQVVAVTNLPPRRIAGFTSDVLVLGAVDPDHGVVLLRPDRDVPNGCRVA
jgi:tRNA-binding protein